MNDNLDATGALLNNVEKEIEKVIMSTSNMYGDLQGIAGRALKEIEGLEVPLIEGEIAK